MRSGSTRRGGSSSRARSGWTRSGYSVGYQDPTFFRRLFKRKTGLTPAAYRRKFATIARSASSSAPGAGADLAAS